jgi:hypothetical protein
VERKFKIEDGPPAWGWARYYAWLRDSWTALLDEADPNDEGLYQDFLEHHPCLLPGGDGAEDSFGGHHGRWGDILVAEPPMPGIFLKRPDFMWLTKNSEDLIPVLIEIEAPGKRWLTDKGDKHHELTHAEGQLADWRQKLDDPDGRSQFADLYEFPQQWAQRFNLVPRLVLIYGRQSEFAERPDWNRKRRGLRDPDIDGMTYDRLRPLPGSANAVTVRVSRANDRVAREAIAIPPTFQFGPENASSVGRVVGLDEAIKSNELIDDDRRDFLLERLPYWQDLGRREIAGENLGIRQPATDWE